MTEQVSRDRETKGERALVLSPMAIQVYRNETIQEVGG